MQIIKWKIYANKGISYFCNKKWQNMFTFTISNDIICTLAEEEKCQILIGLISV